MRFLKNGISNKKPRTPSSETGTLDEPENVTWLNVFLEKLKGFSETKYLLLIIHWLVMGILVIFLLLAFYKNQQLTHILMQQEDKRTVLVHDQISDILTQLDKLSSTSQNSPDQLALAKLSDELRSVEKSMTDVAKSAELQKMAADIDDYFSHLENTVASQGNVKNYLNKKVLPFKVISIDVIAEQPFVSVEYAYHTFPLGVGDSLAGWKVIQADYGAGEVEFINNQGQYVKVSALDNETSYGDKP